MVFGVVVAALLLLGGLVSVGIFRGWPQRLSAEDREVLVVAAELTPHFEFVLRGDAEEYSKTRFYNGRTELSYHYEHPDPAAPFHLECRIVVATDRAEAHSVYHDIAGSLEFRGQDDGATFEERESFPLGEAARYGVLLGPDGVAGHVVACRTGQKVFFLEVLGVGLDDSQWGELTSAGLHSLESYEP
jgi:hypothetical protein